MSLRNKIDEKYYKMLCLTVKQSLKENWFNELYNEINFFAQLKKDNKNFWDYFDFRKSPIDRRQFGMLVGICNSIEELTVLKNEVILIRNRYDWFK